MLKKMLPAATVLLLCLAVPAAQAQQQAIKRTILQKMDFPGGGYATLIVAVEIAAHSLVPRHTHPGIEMGYVLTGEGDLMIDGQPTLHLKPGTSYQIPAGVPHSARTGAAPQRIIVTYVVDKTKPLASPAPR